MSNRDRLRCQRIENIESNRNQLLPICSRLKRYIGVARSNQCGVVDELLNDGSATILCCFLSSDLDGTLLSKSSASDHSTCVVEIAKLEMDHFAVGWQKLESRSSDWVAVDEVGSSCWCVAKDTNGVTGNTKSSIIEAMVYSDLVHKSSGERKCFQIIELCNVKVCFWRLA